MIAGCATSGNPKDPIEGFNRAMFSFNETVDKCGDQARRAGL
jgi:phospholipid-binding lipoprotein MlaA